MTQCDSSIGPLTGLKVLDLGHYYAGPMVGMLLADQGAAVIRIVRSLRQSEIPEPQYRLLNRNKSILELDLQSSEGKEKALELVDNADVLLENFRPGVMKRLGLDYESVSGRNPGLVYLSLPGFASNDKKRAGIQAWDGVVCAAAGLYTETHPFRQILGFPPVYSWVPHCSAYAAMHGASAVVATPTARDRIGHGTQIEVPLVDAGLSGFTTGFAQGNYVLGVISGRLRSTGSEEKLPGFLQNLVFDPNDTPEQQMGKLEQAHHEFWSAPLGRFYHCGDGRPLLMWCGQKPYASEVLKALGIYSQLLEEGFMVGSPSDPCEHNIITGLSETRAARLRQIISDVLITRPAAEWEALLADKGPVVMARTRAEWLALEPMMESGVLTRMDNGRSVLTVPGRAVDISGVDPVFNEPVIVDFDKAKGLLQAGGEHRVKERAVPPDSVERGDLLSGLKVLDLSSVLAGPTAGWVLAQYGADVIKADAPDYAYIVLDAAALDVNQGKRSLLNDIKTADGREIFRRLVQWADVVLHNCLDSVAERLGVAHHQLRAINPSVVSCQISAFGGTWRGGWEGRPGFDPVATAATSLMVHYSTLEHPQKHGSTSCGDIMGGLSLAYSAILAVYYQRRTGESCAAQTSLARANNFIQLPYMIAEEGSCFWGEDHGQFALGDHPWQRLYECSDGWVYVGAVACRAGELAAAVCGTGSNDTVCDADVLAKAFMRENSDTWCRRLQEAGFGCHKTESLNDICIQGIRSVDNEADVEYAQGALEVLRWDSHPCGAPVILPAPSWVRVGRRHSYRRLTPSPRLGTHSREVLAQLGYSPEEIERLIQLKVVHTYVPALGNESRYFCREPQD